jgi:hypothetical protein
MNNPNPFHFAKSERETDVTVYISEEWATPQSTTLLIEGIRGSGKTAILKALEYKTAWKLWPTIVNGPESLVRTYTAPPNYLAVRYRAETMDKKYWNGWRIQYPNDLDCLQMYFGVYLELVFLNMFFSALGEIAPEEESTFGDANSERLFVREIHAAVVPNESKRSILHGDSFKELAAHLRGMHLNLRDLVYRRAKPDTLIESFHTYPPGSLIQLFASEFAKRFDPGRRWRVFAMVDDCNQMWHWQGQVLNSAILRAEDPLYYKVTSVPGLYPARETIDSRPFTAHELPTFSITGSISGKPGAEMKTYIKRLQGICRCRIEKTYNKKLASKFYLNSTLGTTNVEKYLAEMLRNDSQKTLAHELLDKAGKLDPPNVTAVWIVDNNVAHIRDAISRETATGPLAKRKLATKVFTKYRNTAVGAICRELGLDFPYAGVEAFVHLSGGSAREFLRLMQTMWDICECSPEQFVSNQIPFRDQRKASRKVAKQLFVSLSERPLFTSEEPVPCSSPSGIDYGLPGSIRFICWRLGQIFQMMQSKDSCVTAEAASFSVKKAGLSNNMKHVIEVGILSAALLVDMEDVSDERASISIAINPMFAPLFNLPYRWPFYYPVSIETESLEVLCLGSEKEYCEVRERFLKARKEHHLDRDETTNEGNGGGHHGGGTQQELWNR